MRMHRLFLAVSSRGMPSFTTASNSDCGESLMNEKVLLILSVVAAAAGQILFKKGVSLFDSRNLSFTLHDLPKTLAGIVLNPPILIGLVFYGSSTLFWLVALSKTRLNYAYPFTALTFVLVMLASWFIFSEPMPVNRIVGVVLICCGFIVAALK